MPTCRSEATRSFAHQGKMRARVEVSLPWSRCTWPHATTLEQSCEGQLWIQIGGSAGQQSVFVCNAYMPQASSKEPCDAAYAKLEENLRQQGCVIVLGDLNARVGPATRNWPPSGLR